MAGVEDFDDLILLRERSNRAYAELHRRYAAGIISDCEGILHRHDLAENIKQDVFLELWTQRRDWVPESLPAWMHGVARHKALDLLRKLERDAGLKKRVREALNEEAPEDRTLENIVSAQRIMAMLRPAERPLFELHVVEKKSWKEVAQIIGGTPDAAQKNFERACHRLREQHPDDHPD